MKAGFSAISIAVSLALSSTVSADSNATVTKTTLAVGGDSRAAAGEDLLARFAPGTIAFGPIESVDVDAGQLTILGQVFQSNASHVFLDQLSAELRTGQFRLASVVNRIEPDNGTSKTELQVVSSSYIPGSTPVLVAGRVSAARSSIARFKLGKLAVDYSALMSSSEFNVSPGDFVVVAGTTYGIGSVLSASALRKVSRDAIIGGDRNTDAIIGGDRSTDAIIGGDR
jgi:hypothetical protein